MLLAPTRTGGPDFDRAVVAYLVERRADWLTTAMRAASRIGSTIVLVPLAVLIGVGAHRRSRRWTTMVRLAVGLGGSVALYHLVKALVGRARPRVGALVATAAGDAFPSGHATQTAAMAVIVAMAATALTVSRARKVTAWSTAAGVALLVSFSRVYLGVHWPTDVMAGCALGALWAVAATMALPDRPGPSDRAAAARAPLLPQSGGA